jgi:hypothetical protein
MAFSMSSELVVLNWAATDAATAWAATAAVPSVAGRWSAYLNYLCQLTLTPWLRSLDLDLGPCWPDRQEGLTLWPAVSGFRVTLGPWTMVMVPSEAIDSDTVTIPQEWVDIPNWVADYYLAIQMWPEDQGLQLLGCFAYAQVQQAPYQRCDRSYELTDVAPRLDLDALVVAHQSGIALPSGRPVAPSPLPPLSDAIAETLLQQTQHYPPALVRLMLPFEQWAGLVAENRWRQRLAQSAASPSTTPFNAAVVSLGDWLSQGLSHGWQALDDLTAWVAPTAAVALRQLPPTSGPMLRVGKRLPATPGATAELLLVMSMQTLDDGRRAIRVQLYPLATAHWDQLQLRLVADGQTLQSVTARPQDHYIQLKSFRCPPDQSFSLEVTTPTLHVHEQFLA